MFPCHLQDALTDLTAHSECIELEEVGDGRAHKGILQAARYIKNTLNNMQLLETAFQRGQVTDNSMLLPVYQFAIVVKMCILLLQKENIFKSSTKQITCLFKL